MSAATDRNWLAWLSLHGVDDIGFADEVYDYEADPHSGYATDRMQYGIDRAERAKLGCRRALDQAARRAHSWRLVGLALLALSAVLVIAAATYLVCYIPLRYDLAAAIFGLLAVAAIETYRSHR